jgi:cytochrome c biogenesis protein CcdA
MRGKIILCFWLLCGIAHAAPPIQIDFFYEPGCHDCEQIEQEVLPEIGKRFPDQCVIQRYDIGIETNFLYLLQLEDSLGYDGSERGYLIVNKQAVFGPRPDVEELCAVISGLLEPREDGFVGDVALPMHSESGGRASLSERADTHWAEERFGGFTLSAVLVAGLLDGINPCAISTLVFFMSLLAVAKVKSRSLIWLGISYVLASFLTYLALGFGLFRVLHLFSGYTVLRSAVEWGMVVILLVLAALSFRDALRFRKTHDGHDVTLQLSTGMKQRIHNVMRRGLGTRSIVLGGLLVGMAVTALESVCTGQVYVPTLVLILKTNALAESRAWLYLIAYNLLFILPLVSTFIAVTFGLRTETLLRWSRQNVVLSKILLAFFFLIIACLIRN